MTPRPEFTFDALTSMTSVNPCCFQDKSILSDNSSLSSGYNSFLDSNMQITRIYSAQSPHDDPEMAPHRTKKTSTSQRPTGRRKSPRNRPTSSRTPLPPRPPAMTEEERRLCRLMADAKRHQAVTSRVSNLSDFSNMSVTLPAGTIEQEVSGVASCEPNRRHAEEYRSLRRKEKDADSATSKTCLSAPTVLRSRRAGPMFRGKKSWTSSAAADLCVTEARQADQYYRRSLARSCHSLNGEDDPRLQRERDVLSGMEENKAPNNRWNGWLPKKWTTPKSTLIDI